MEKKYYHDHLLKVYQESFRNNWDLPALTEYGADEVLSYGEMARRIARFHLFFKQIGLKHGDKVALLGKNSSTWVMCFMATITYGATIVPILSDFNPRDAQHIINHSEATLLFVSNQLWETYDFDRMPALKAAISLETRHVLAERSEKGEQPVERIIRNISRRFRSIYKAGFNPADIIYPEVDKDATAVLNYTSGTTGFSKGVMLSYDNLLGNVMFGR